MEQPQAKGSDESMRIIHKLVVNEIIYKLEVNIVDISPSSEPSEIPEEVAERIIGPATLLLLWLLLSATELGERVVRLLGLVVHASPTVETRIVSRVLVLDVGLLEAGILEPRVLVSRVLVSLVSRIQIARVLLISRWLLVTRLLIPVIGKPLRLSRLLRLGLSLRLLLGWFWIGWFLPVLLPLLLSSRLLFWLWLWLFPKHIRSDILCPPHISTGSIHKIFNSLLSRIYLLSYLIQRIEHRLVFGHLTL